MGESEGVRTIRTQISRLERQREALDQKIRTLQRKELHALPGRMGFENTDQLILALAEYASPALRMRLQSFGATATSMTIDPMSNVAGARTLFPQAVKEKIRAALQSGEKSVAQLSQEYGPSQPSIRAWKRAWGLTRPHRKRRPEG